MGYIVHINRVFRSAAFLAVLGLSSAIVSPAYAQKMTLMDFFRGGKKEVTAGPQAENPAGVASASAASAAVGSDVDPEPITKISAPKYYGYKADASRKINTSGFGAGFEGVTINATPEVAKAVEEYYTSGKGTVWLKDGQINDKAKAVLAFFESVDQSGLNPADYTISIPSLEVTGSVVATPEVAASGQSSDVGPTKNAAPALAVEPRPTDPALLSFEVALSARVLGYIQDVNRGRIDPNKLSGYHDFKRKTVNLKPILNLARLSPDVPALLKGREPSSADYLALKNKLKMLRQSDASQARIDLPNDLLLKPGNSHSSMSDVLRGMSLKASPELKAQIDQLLNALPEGNLYSPEIVELVKAFQEENGLKPDGVIGRASVRAIVGDSDSAKINKLIVALEQIRWLPADLGDRFVFINQPAFMAYYHEDSAEQFGMKVVIGSKANQTYFFQDMIQTVEVNPYWGVPQSIIVNEMLPKLRQDPSYLDKSGYEVQVAGRTVASSNVNWNTTVKNIAVRQPPGKSNALGELKILFPNSHAIYMHDTPSKGFFNRDNRALSHGCIRLVDPRKMAAAVLGTSVQKVGEQIASGQNRAIQVPKKIPVYIAYFTAWPNKNGQVEYFDDVYGRDDYVMKAFDVTSKSREKSI
jgi:murein L,D-transpeptidase YcbB/YkuD